jgi:hypothetical protein
MGCIGREVKAMNDNISHMSEAVLEGYLKRVLVYGSDEEVNGVCPQSFKGGDVLRIGMLDVARFGQGIIKQYSNRVRFLINEVFK